MGNIVDIQVTDEKVILKVRNKDIVNEIDNVASFDSKTKKLISTGVTQKTFQEDYPKKWNKYKDRIEFHPIFDTVSFNPEATVMFLLGWWNEMTRQGVAGQIILRSQAKLEINISFDHYDEIRPNIKQDFEYLVFRYLYAKKLIINGSERPWDKKNNPPIWIFSILNYMFILGFMFLGFIPIFGVMSLLAATKLSSWSNIFLFGLVVLGGSYLVSLLGDLLSKLLWIICMKPFFSRKMLARVFEYQINLPQKQKLSKSTSFLVNWLLVENS